MAGNDTHDKQALPSGWVWTTIGEIALPIEKVQPREKPQTRFTYLDISSIDNSVNRVVAPKIYLGEEAPSRARQLVRANDVLFSTVRPYLKNIALVPEIHDGQIATTGFSVLRGASGISPKYLFYYTLTDKFLDDIRELQRGTSYPAVRDGDVRAQPIPLPPTAEQLRIVAETEKHFSRLEVAESLLTGMQIKLRRYRASVLKAACEGCLVPTEAELACAEGRDYEPADQLLSRILAERRARWETEQWSIEIEKAQQKAAIAARKVAGQPPKRGEKLLAEEWENIAESEYSEYLPKDDKWKWEYKEPIPPDTEGLPTLPEGWVWTTLDMMAEVRSGITKGRDLSRFETVEVPYLRVANVQSGYLDLSEVKTIEIKASELEKYRLHLNDILFTEGGDRDKLGRGTVWRNELELCTHQNHVFVARLHTMEVSPNWVSLASQTSYARDYFWRVARQTTNLASINTTKLRAFPVPLPPTKEQRRIVEEVERRFSMLAEIESAVAIYIVRAERLRQAILEQAFKGKLVPQNPTDEPAEALLASIGKEREKLEQEREAEQRAKRKRAREARQMARRARRRRTLWEVLVERASPVTPEKLFQDAGFDREKIEEIEEFFDELAMEVDGGRVKEIRPNKADVYLEAVGHET